MSESRPIVERRILGGCPCVRREGSKFWAPDYSVPGTREIVNRRVQEAEDAHWSIERHRQ